MHDEAGVIHFPSRVGAPNQTAKRPRHVLGIRHLVTVAKSHGVSLDNLLERSGITLEMLARLNIQVEAWQEIRVIRNLLRHVSRPGLGFAVGRLYRPTSLGPLGMAMTASTTLRQALKIRDRFQSLGLSLAHTLLHMREDGREWITFDHTIVPRDIRTFVAEREIASTIQIVEDLLSRDISTPLVEVRAAEPEDIVTYHADFPWSVRFGADQDAISLPASDLFDKLPWANEDACEYGERACRAICGPLGILEFSDSPLSARVQRLIAQELALAFKMSEVARILGMSERTLGRNLRRESTSFLRLADSVRRQIAERELLEARRSVRDVAEMLGYSDDTSFLRAFRRWSGHTVTHFLEKVPVT